MGERVWKNVRCAESTSGSIRQDRVELAAAGWLIAWELLIGCGVLGVESSSVRACRNREEWGSSADVLK
jgi:hypothetical protein